MQDLAELERRINAALQRIGAGIEAAPVQASLALSSESAADLGEAFGHGLTAAEVEYLIAYEWARTAADVLWRRTKLGLHFTDAQTARLAAYITERITPA